MRAAEVAKIADLRRRLVVAGKVLKRSAGAHSRHQLAV